MKYTVLYNAKANNGRGFEEAKAIEAVLLGNAIDYVDVFTIENYDDYVTEKSKDSKVVICGGDGTIYYYINHTSDITKEIDIDYWATGTGNDFLRDIGGEKGKVVENVNKYMKNLPTVTVKGATYRFINGVGYGIDGYCCEVGDIQRTKSTKKVDYTGIAIKGILFHFRPRTATITIDGKTFEAKNSWLVPTMKGKYYGGGMMPCPTQDRNDPERKVSLMTYQTAVGLKALIVFPNIFKGEHTKSKIVNVYSGHEIHVSFDKPCALQIDGDTISDVSEYTVKSF